METLNIWYKLHLHRKKIVYLLILFVILPLAATAQKAPSEINLPNYDQRRLRYGFIIGVHSSNYSIAYSDAFTTSLMDSVHSIVPPNTPGFSLGFIVNLRIAQYLDFRLLPKVSFYESEVEYNYTNLERHTEVVDRTVVEFPMLFKFKSQRRKNSRVYLVAGLTPGIDASGKKDDENNNERLLVKRGNLSVDFGFGIDLYYPLFKFSPELRFSKGVMNVIKPETNPYSQGIDRMTTNTITLYLQFE